MKSTIELLAYSLAFILLVSVPIIYWIGSSHFEARAYSRITGQQVSTWDAMFVELRVDQPVERRTE